MEVSAYDASLFFAREPPIPAADAWLVGSIDRGRRFAAFALSH